MTAPKKIIENSGILKKFKVLVIQMAVTSVKDFVPGVFFVFQM